jgi:hypothetical protein
MCICTNIWINYAVDLYSCSRNPTPEITSLLDVTWQPVEKNKTNYLNIDAELTMHEHYEQERMAFWDNVYSSKSERKAKL